MYLCDASRATSSSYFLPTFSTQEAEIRALEARIRAECSGRVAASTSTANPGQAWGN